MESLETMLPIRREILEIISDHPNCSFDFIWRRFTTFNPSTIHYHLAQLAKNNFIYKLGSTRGVLYTVVS